MWDLSASPVRITITLDSGNLVIINPADIADQGTPLSPARANISNLEIDMNGEAVVSHKAEPIQVSISLIPGSPSDKRLRSAVYMARRDTTDLLAGGKTALSSANVKTMAISYPWPMVGVKNVPDFYEVIYESGTITAGTLSPGASQDGRLVCSVYEMKFAQVRS